MTYFHINENNYLLKNQSLCMRLQKEELATVAILICAVAAVGILYVFLSGSTHAQYSASSKDGDTIYAQGHCSRKIRPRRAGTS